MKKTGMLLALIVGLCASGSQPTCADEKVETIKWESWSPAVFERAKKEKSLMILDLEAIWCHWCHVMDETTYKDSAVIKLMNSKYIAIKVDQDSRPDVSNRYEDYGWPATIIFDSNGQELVKRSGYIPPERMTMLLQAVIADPTPGPSAGGEEKVQIPDSPFLSKQVKKKLLALVRSHYDFKKGGWDIDHKFLDGFLVEYLLKQGWAGDKKSKKMALQTLDHQLSLIDPAWGGVYQYSVGGDWKEPHFEKIMSVQSDNLRIYSLAYGATKNAKYLKAANDIHKYLQNFLTSPDGPFYTSQDADLVQGQHGGDFFKMDDRDRRKKGIPRIDKDIYSRENGWVTVALTTLYAMTGDEAALNEATRSAQWIIANRKQKDGGYNHDVKDPAGPYLGDSLSMANAFLNLYMVTGQRNWLKESEETAKFILKEFKTDGGLTTAKSTAADVFPPGPESEENVQAVRYFNLLFHYTGNKTYRQAAEGAMRFVASAQISERLFTTPGVLLADSELAGDPLHITVLGSKNDDSAKTLFLAGLKYPVSYKRLEWWDKKEGPLPQQDVQFPDMPAAAAFACSGDRCSLPAKSADELDKRINAMLGETKD